MKKKAQLDFIDANRLRSKKVAEKRRGQYPHQMENFEVLKETGVLEKIEWTIYYTLLNYGSMTTLEMATMHGVQRDSYSPQMKELVRKKAISKGPRTPDKISGYKAIHWIANPGWTQK